MDHSSDLASGMLATALVLVPFAALIGLPIWSAVASSRRARRQSLSIADGTVSIRDSAYGRGREIPIERIGTVVYLPEREATTETTSTSAADTSPTLNGVPASAPRSNAAKAATRTTAAPAMTAAQSIGSATTTTSRRTTMQSETHTPRVGKGADMFVNGGLIVLDVRGRMVGHVAYERGSYAPLATVWRQIPAPNHVRAPMNRAGTGYSRAAFKRAFPRALRFGQLWTSRVRTWTVLGLIFIGIPVLSFVGLFAWAFVHTWIEMYG